MGVAVNSIVQVTYWQRLFGQRILNVYDYRVVQESTLPIFDELNNLALTMASLLETNAPLYQFSNYQSVDLIYDEVRVQPIAPLRNPYQKAAIGQTGQYSTGTEVTNLAVSVTKRTLDVGRRAVGRVQLAGIPTAAMRDGEIDPTYAAALQGAATNCFTNSITVTTGGGEYRMAVWGPGRVINSLIDVVQARVNPELRTMHRRTVRLGI